MLSSHRGKACASQIMSSVILTSDYCMSFGFFVIKVGRCHVIEGQTKFERAISVPITTSKLCYSQSSGRLLTVIKCTCVDA